MDWPVSNASIASIALVDYDDPMASLSVRKIDEETYRRLRIRAAEHGISMEEEVRQILKRAVTAPGRLGDLAVEYFGRNHGVNFDLPPRESHEPPDLNE